MTYEEAATIWASRRLGQPATNATFTFMEGDPGYSTWTPGWDAEFVFSATLADGTTHSETLDMGDELGPLIRSLVAIAQEQP